MKERRVGKEEGREGKKEGRKTEIKGKTRRKHFPPLVHPSVYLSIMAVVAVNVNCSHASLENEIFNRNKFA